MAAVDGAGVPAEASAGLAAEAGYLEGSARVEGRRNEMDYARPGFGAAAARYEDYDYYCFMERGDDWEDDDWDEDEEGEE